MGTTSFTKDSNVDLYFQLNKPFYYVGEWVEGTAYLVVKNNVFYNALYIRLEGKQYCHWSQGSGKNRRSYTGSRQTYEDEFIISKSDVGFAKGHYSYPFTFQLPVDMSGSYMIGDRTNFYIQYPLQVRLVDFQGKNDPQLYSYNITVLEPPRMPMQALQGSKQTNPQVCCCFDQGYTALTVKFDRNIAQSGDVVNLNIAVDNRRCKKKINRVFVRFTKHLFAESNGGNHRNWKTFMTTSETPPIQIGATAEIPLAVPVPPIVNPTAIGAILANYYTIDVQSNLEGCVCCCGDMQPLVEGHIMITTQTPQINVKPQMTAPQGWNPTVSPLVVYNAVKPFVYQHNHNLKGICNKPQYPL